MATISLSGITFPYINHRVYNNGINKDFIVDQGNEALVIALLSADGEILAYSAAIKNAGTDQNGAIADQKPNSAGFYGAKNGFTFASKKLTIPEISYMATKNSSVVTDGADGKQAIYFAIFRFNTDNVNVAQAFDKAGYFNYPLETKDVFSLDNLLLIGNINGTPYISDNSNFRLTQTTISFSEQNNA